MKPLLSTWTRRVAFGVFVVWASGAQPVEAAPIAALEHLETDLGSGLFQYEYTLYHLGDPVADAGYDAYDLFLSFSPLASIVSSATPTGWDVIAGPGFLDSFSVLPGLAPLGTDIGPGQSLGNFTFVFDAQVGSLPFQVVFANPVDPFNPVTYDGVSAPAVAPVPEPTSLLLLGTGLGSLIVARRRKRRRERSNS